MGHNTFLKAPAYLKGVLVCCSPILQMLFGSEQFAVFAPSKVRVGISSEEERNGDQAFRNMQFFSAVCENLINILFQNEDGGAGTDSKHEYL